jgi:hypothetical protein
VWVCLLLLLAAWPQAWPQDAPLQVAVGAGQLSVDLPAAPVREVWAAIGQQAGLRVRIDAEDARTMTAQFTAMDVEQSLHRLSRAASLSDALQYARVPGAPVALHEVRVFREARGADRVPATPFGRARAGAPPHYARGLVERTHCPAIGHIPAPPDAPMVLEPDEPEPEASEPDLNQDWQDSGSGRPARCGRALVAIPLRGITRAARVAV